MLNDDLEFSISQYLDGTLSAEERMALELRLEGNAEARALLEEYRGLDVAMKAMPLPVMNWAALSASISAAVDAADEAHAPSSYRMSAWIRTAIMPLALAASVMIVAGVGFEIYRSHQSPTGWNQGSTGSVAKAIDGSSMVQVAFQTEKSAGPVVEEVAIGPGAASKDEPIVVSYSDDVVSRPSHIAVASGVVPAHDTVPVSSFDMQ